jgi:hypothetical protein
MHSFAPAGIQLAEDDDVVDDVASGFVCPKARLEEKRAIAADDTAAVPSHRLFTA